MEEYDLGDVKLRDVFSEFLGDTLVDISQPDPGEEEDWGDAIWFHFASGKSMVIVNPEAIGSE